MKKPWEKILPRLSEPNSDLQIKTLRELAEMKAGECIPDIIRLAQSGEDSVKLEAMVALGKIADPKSGEEILPFLEKKDDVPFLMEVITTLGTIGANGFTGAAKALHPMLDHEHYRVRKFAIQALGNCGNVESIDALYSHFQKEDVSMETKEAIALSIGQIGGSRAMEILTNLVLPSEKSHVLSKEVRRAAIQALGDMRSPRALEVLGKVYNDDEEDKVIRKYAEAAIRKTIDGAKEWYLRIKDRAETILKGK
jgi:HEAT repeat protein